MYHLEQSWHVTSGGKVFPIIIIFVRLFYVYLSILDFSYSCLVLSFLSHEITQTKFAQPSTWVPSKHLKIIIMSLFFFIML